VSEPQAGRWLGVAEIAERAGVKPQTWTGYVNRGHAPQAGRRSPETGRREWLESVIDAWLRERPGAGARTDLRRD
jgi:predicted DNA-binding transcriptional regulator AlpA